MIETNAEEIVRLKREIEELKSRLHFLLHGDEQAKIDAAQQDAARRIERTEVIITLWIDGMTRLEIGRRIGIKPSTVGKLLQKSLGPRMHDRPSDRHDFSRSADGWKRARVPKELILDLRVYGTSRKDIAAYLGLSIVSVAKAINEAKRSRERESWSELERTKFPSLYPSVVFSPVIPRA